MYKKIDDNIVSKLIEIAGKDAVLYEDDEKLRPYSYDEAAKNDKLLQQMPAALVKVSNPQEVSQILKLANDKKIPVTPRGAGSGLSGAAVPYRGGIVISTERMNRIIEVDSQSLTATVEPGVITNNLNQAALKEGLFFAGYPLSRESCTIGGNIAHNAGGARALKYGVTGHHVLGLEIILPTGEIVNFGGKTFKDVSPYNMVQLMLGSEGTLGFISKITLKLLPVPAVRTLMLVAFDEVFKALSVVPLILNRMKTIPSAIEFMDRESINITYKNLGKNKPVKNCGAILIIELDGDEADAVRKKYLEIGDLCLEEGALEAFAAETPAEQDDIWKIRVTCPEVLHSLSKHVFSEDISVPPDKISTMVDKSYKLATRHGVKAFIIGHAGDGNIHIFTDKMPEMSVKQWEKVKPEFLKDLYSCSAELGGTVTGEHGIGRKRKKYLSMFFTEDELNVMRKIKKALDPNNIMNPGVKFDL